MTDPPPQENLQFLSEIKITADHSFLRFHGRNTKGYYWYNYLYPVLIILLKPYNFKLGALSNSRYH
jgi:hypothetical protein